MRRTPIERLNFSFHAAIAKHQQCQHRAESSRDRRDRSTSCILCGCGVVCAIITTLAMWRALTAGICCPMCHNKTLRWAHILIVGASLILIGFPSEAQIFGVYRQLWTGLSTTDGSVNA